MTSEQLIEFCIGIIGGCTIIMVTSFAYSMYWRIKVERERRKAERERERMNRMTINEIRKSQGYDEIRRTE